MTVNKPKELYHYTIGQRLASIIADGVIKPATAYVSEGERSAVWFTINPDWDETANKDWQNPDGSIKHLSREETEARGGGLVRLVVEPRCAPYAWREYVKRSRIEEKIALALADSARKSGVRVEDWRVAFRPIPRAYWLRVDIWYKGEWHPVEVPPEDKTQ